MKIIINGKEAVLEKNISFEYIAENRLFTKADGYTLSITFPLRGCPENIKIFGQYNRKDITINKKLFDCDIHDKNIHLHGSITIIEVTDKDVKTQFLSGKSAQNFSFTLEEMYINELNLGEINKYKLETEVYQPDHFWTSIDDESNEGFVALPWVNNTSGNMQNGVIWDSNMKQFLWNNWTPGIYHVSFQMYLIEVAKRICDAVQFSYSFGEWEASHDRHLIICNTFPAAWDNRNIAAVLPHWTVEEFFSQLELLIDAQFDIDIEEKKISMTYNNTFIARRKVVVLDNIIDSFTCQVKEENSESYIRQRNLRYASDSHNMQKYYSCDWFIEMMKSQGKVQEWTSVERFMNYAKSNLLHISGNKLSSMAEKLHHAGGDIYFICRVYKADYNNEGKVTGLYTEPVQVNQFAPLTFSKGGKEEECKFIPAWLDYADSQKVFFLECGEYGERTGDEDIQSFTTRMINNGEDSKKEFFTNIYIGYWPGYHYRSSNVPYPIIDIISAQRDYTYYQESETLDLRIRKDDHYKQQDEIYIDSTKQYNMSFISKKIPDTGSIFIIKGKRFLCEKITATFTIDGMSQLLKGVFYRVI